MLQKVVAFEFVLATACEMHMLHRNPCFLIELHDLKVLGNGVQKLDLLLTICYPSLRPTKNAKCMPGSASVCTLCGARSRRSCFLVDPNHGAALSSNCR